MRVLFILVILLSLALNVNAETEWEKWLDGIMLDGDYSEDTHEELYENLLELQRNGINVNSATREELLALPFLSEQQVMDILEYIHFHGALKSINELMSIESIDYSTRQLLQEFLYAGDKPEKGFPSLKNIMTWGKMNCRSTPRFQHTREWETLRMAIISAIHTSFGHVIPSPMPKM